MDAPHNPQDESAPQTDAEQIRDLPTADGVADKVMGGTDASQDISMTSNVMKTQGETAKNIINNMK